MMSFVWKKALFIATLLGRILGTAFRDKILPDGGNDGGNDGGFIGTELRMLMAFVRPFFIPSVWDSGFFAAHNLGRC